MAILIATGAALAIPPSAAAAFAGENGLIAYECERRRQICVVDPTDASTEELTASSRRSFDPSFSADGRELVFMRRLPSGRRRDGSRYERTAILIRDMASGTVARVGVYGPEDGRVLSKTNGRVLGNPHFNATGQRILFTAYMLDRNPRGFQILGVARRGGEPRLTGGGTSWSIEVSTAGEILTNWRDYLSGYQGVRISFADGSSAGGFSDYDDDFPAPDSADFAPSDDRILFGGSLTRRDEETDEVTSRYGIYTALRDGTQRVTLLEASPVPSTEPAPLFGSIFSPDGEQVAFLDAREGSGFALSVLEIQSGEVTPLVDGAVPADWGPAPAADGP